MNGRPDLDDVRQYLILTLRVSHPHLASPQYGLWSRGGIRPSRHRLTCRPLRSMRPRGTGPKWISQSPSPLYQGGSDVEVAPPTDLTAVMGAPHGQRHTPAPEATAVTPRRALVVIRRRCLTQRLMGPLLVVVPPEDGEAPALRPQARGRWRGRLQNHRPMQTLQASILLRLARIDPLRQHTRLHHLHRKRRQAASPHRTKRWPVVRTQHTRQPILPERRLQNRPGMCHIRLLQPLAAQQITAYACQGIAPLPVATVEPTLVVDTPHIVRTPTGGKGAVRGGARRRLRRDTTRPSRCSNSPMLLSAGHRTVDVDPGRPGFLRTPRPDAYGEAQAPTPPPPHSVRMTMRRTALVQKFPLIPSAPLVRRLSAHPVTPAQLRDRRLLFSVWHRSLSQPPCPCTSPVTYVPVYSVTYVPGSDRGGIRESTTAQESPPRDRGG